MTRRSQAPAVAGARRLLDIPATSRWASLVGIVLTLGWAALVVAEAKAAPGKDGDAVFARVGSTVITQQAYDQAYATAARSKFYHGKPPEAEVAKLQREVGDTLVNDVLLQHEAKRRKLQPDRAAIKKQLDDYEARYKSNARWQASRDTLLPPLRKKLEDQSLIDQLKASVRNVPEPKQSEVEAYYAKNKDKFTEPEQVKVSLILLRVDPSSPQAKWDGAMAEGQAISRRLKAGAPFAELAKLHSNEESAKKGGDMGYLHRGMLPDPAQQAVDKLKPGEISGAVAMLEGVAVFRLDDRKPAKLNPLSAVRERAGDLLQRDQADQAWTDFVARLRRETPVRIDESRYLPLPVPVANVKPTGK